jgi:MFS family permease
VLLLIFIDRTGKGIRTAPRDALISLSGPPESLGLAFGVHRALDTIGALLGPLVAFGLLLLVPFGFDVIFMVSFAIAIVGVGIITTFVRDVARAPGRQAPALGSIAALLRDPRFAPLLLITAVLGLATISDAFLYVMLQRRTQLAIGFVPLLFVATSLVYASLAVPAGRLADRVGRKRVFLAGYALLPIAYAALLILDSAWPIVAISVALLGAYYAATDGVLMAIASPRLDRSVRTSGLAALTTVTALSRLVASVAFGAAWTFFSGELAVAVFAAALTVALGIAAFLFMRLPEAGIDAAS